MNPLRTGLQRFFSETQLERLAAIRIGIAGAGGLGSNCAVALVRSGIRKLTIADMDHVEASNLNRQSFFPDQVGLPKVQALADILLRIEPNLELELHKCRVSTENAVRLFTTCPIVVEAFDNPADKAMLLRCLCPTGVFMVGASGIGGIGGLPMSRKQFGQHAVIIGDGTTPADKTTPPFAPRVAQAAAMQADAVLEYIMKE